MHGKRGSAEYLSTLAGDLAEQGYLVVTPDMPWSKVRAYDRALDEAHREIDKALDGLRLQGATRLVVAGHSMGANMAIGYAATHKGIDAVIALGPGQTVESQNFIERLGDSVTKAKALLAAGQGEELTQFQDLHLGKVSEIVAIPRIYLSYFDPDGLANMPRMARHIDIPFLWTVGSQDKNMFNRGPAYAFDLAKPNPYSRYVVVDADHMGTPEASRAEVLRWLKGIFQTAIQRK
jgi:pimeloyl-ACP methyl ester carboxylesterase